MNTKTQTKQVNGVDVEQLLETIAAVSGSPKLGASTFCITNQWKGGDKNLSTIGDFKTLGKKHRHKRTFVYESGEPQAYCGSDEGANPVEFLLHALAGCVTTATAMHAAARGIKIESIETSIEGDLDLQGLFGLGENVTAGYTDIRMQMKIVSDAEGAKLEELKTLHQFSPVFQTIKNPVQLHVDLELNRS